MAKFYGAVGFIRQVETEGGIWEEVPNEYNYYGDILKNKVVTQTQGSINMSTSISTEISIISDPFANENFDAIKYVVYLGKKWTVTSYDVEYPRIRLMLGGIYNG